jgi:hypothetical protein
MSHDTLSAPGLLLRPQDTGRAAAGRGARSRRGAAHGPPAEATVDLEGLAKKLLARLGPRRALLLASLIDETVADEAEGGA